MMSLKLLVFVIGLAAVTEIRAQQFSSSEDYRICCHTRLSGYKCMEAFPKSDVVSMEDQSDHPDQKWKLLSLGGNSYAIQCRTLNSGPLNIEAYPGVWLVRMKNADTSNRDQQFTIEQFSPGSNMMRISVNTAASGWKSLEAYPQDGVVRTRDNSLAQDQQWEIKRW